MIKRAFRSVVVAIAVLVGSCSDGVVDTMTPPPTAPPPAPPPPAAPPSLPVTGPGPFLVSNPVARTGTGAIALHSGGDAWVWIALQPGRMSEFTTVRLRVQRTEVETVAALQDGGLDPVAIEAVAGDTVVLRMDGGPRTAPAALVFAVPQGVPPTIVRTVPPRGTRDVALNSRMQVVFSEPLSESVFQPGAVVLEANGAPVAGQVRFDDTARTVVEFVPSALLAPGTPHRLTITRLVTDLDGTTLPDSRFIDFVTEGTPEIPAPPPPFEGTTVGEFAFVRNRQIFRSTAEGVLQLTNTPAGTRNATPAWSPDGSRIAFSSDRDGVSSIYVMNADGSNVIRLTSGEDALNPNWAPDGLSLVYEAWTYGDPYISIRRISSEGGVPVTLLESADGVMSPSISPDGSSMAVSISRSGPVGSWWGWAFDIYRMAPTPGAAPVRIHAGPEGAPYVHFFDSAWSPDGQWIAMSECEDEFQLCAGADKVSIVRADGTGYTTLMVTGTQSRPSWSPDGTRVAFTSGTNCAGLSPCLVVMQASGGMPTVILNNAREGAWRP